MNDFELPARVKAGETRWMLGVSANEPLDIFKLLHDTLDIHIVFKPLQSGLSGVFLRLEKTGLILVNSAKTLGHQRFTAAHELFHLRYDEGLTHRICSAGQFDRNVQEGEKEADFFAANLLSPDEAVHARLYRRRRDRTDPITLDDVIDLEQYFGVSHQAMLIRLRFLGLLSQEQAEELKTNVVTVARSLGYEPDLYQPTHMDKFLSSYAAKAKNALERGLISDGKYEQLLLEAGYADLLYGLEEGEVSEEI